MRQLVLRWKISRIASAARKLIEGAGSSCRVWWFGAYQIHPKHLVFVLKVSSDHERNNLRNDVVLLSSVRDLLVKYDWPKEARNEVVFDIESQETVDRENNGNWFYHYK